MSRKPVRLVLFSEVNSKFGLPFLRMLSSHPEVSVKALVTSPHGELCSYYVDEPDPVDLELEACSLNIQVLRPVDVNAKEVIAELAYLEADYFLIANYQQIFKADLLAVPGVATVNFHPSPLPRYAGLAPFFWMAKNGEREGGVSALLVTEQIDAGPLVLQTPVVLSGTETAIEIRRRHFEASVKLLKELVPRLVSRDLEAVEQDPLKRTYYGKVRREDLRIDWEVDTETVLRTVRAGYRFPGALAPSEGGEELVVLSAERAEPRFVSHRAEPGTVHESDGEVLVCTGDGWVRILSVCMEGEEIEVCKLEGELSLSLVTDIPPRWPRKTASWGGGVCTTVAMPKCAGKGASSPTLASIGRPSTGHTLGAPWGMRYGRS